MVKRLVTFADAWWAIHGLLEAVEAPQDSLRVLGVIFHDFIDHSYSIYICDYVYN